MAFAAVMAAVLAATGIFVYQRLDSDLDRAVDRSLRARAADVAALAQQSDSGLKEARSAGAGARRAELAQLIDPSGRVVDHTPGLSNPLLVPGSLAAVRQAGPMVVDARLAVDQPIRLRAEAVRAQGATLVVVVGQSLEDRNRALADLTDVLLLGGPAALGLACLAGYLLTGAALRPVEAMRRRAGEISSSSPEQRLPSAGGNDELGRLGRTLNEMLTRVHASVARERTFVSDASHELRSPLGALRTELELLGRERPTGDALQRATTSAIEETDRLSQLVDDLLLLARADEHRLAVHSTSIPVEELLGSARIRARRQLAASGVELSVVASAGVELTVEAPVDVAVLADPDRLGQVLDNMLANAARYARNRVELVARPRGVWVELHVLDDGPGFPVHFLPQAWERFSRADAGRTGDGAGLGLAIVSTIASLHGGRAQAANRPGGGADVWVTLPRAESREARGHGMRTSPQNAPATSARSEQPASPAR